MFVVVQKGYVRGFIGRAVVFFYEREDRCELRVELVRVRLEGM